MVASRNVPTVLLVDGDYRFAGCLAGTLRGLGYQVIRATDAAGALSTIRCDAVLLDAALSARLCARLRQRHDPALIVLGAGPDDPAAIAALRSGADDFVAKPIRIGELQARLQALLRRRRSRMPAMLAAGRLWIDLDSRRVQVDGTPVRLSHKEFHLLTILAGAGGSVVSRDRLTAEVWNVRTLRGSRTLDVHMATLRSKVRPAAGVENVRGVGYRLVLSPMVAGLAG